MVIRKISKKADVSKSSDKKQIIKKESKKELSGDELFDKIQKERIEKEAQEKKAAEQKIIDAKNERVRAEGIIVPYLESLVVQLKEKEFFSFWTWPDRKGFKKINKTTYDEMQKIVKSDEKYFDRLIAHIKIYTGHKNKYSRKYGTWLSVDISIFHIDEEGNLKNKKDPSWGCHVIWEDDDFKISKLSFKLIEELMRITAAKRHRCESLAGYRLVKVVDALKKKKIDISEFLHPLAGM